jgi:hypothetical protein
VLANSVFGIVAANGVDAWHTFAKQQLLREAKLLFPLKRFVWVE